MTLSILLIGSAEAVAADEWGDQDSNTGAHPDGASHSYCYFSSVSEDLKSGIRASEWNALDPTHANVDYASSCKLSGSGETDVVWRQGNLSGSVRGTAPCEDYDDGDHCDQYYVTIDLAEINKGSNDEADEEKTTCHELGHTVGLTHGGSSDCMLNGEVPSTALRYHRYNTHHLGHINAWF